ncbi:MAG TPA: hypothetical protein VN539_05275, partial [Candidatus Saccharimonadales bacterium]|nr:hypothetical protein [Candidatus Saccharimonadales bacterium]
MLALVLLPAPSVWSAAVDSTEAGGTERWLPIPEEDLESTEALEEDRPGIETGALVRAVVTRGQARLRRVAADAGRGEMGFLLDEGRVRPGARLEAGAGRLALAGGRISLARLPPLLADAMRLTASGRRVPSPRTGSIDAHPSLGSSAGAIDGAAVTMRSPALWSFAGVRSGSREALGGIGLGIARGGTRASAALGAVGRAGRVASLTLVHRRPERRGSLELLYGTTGRALLAEAAASGEGVLVSARWRYRSWIGRRVAAEMSATTPGPGSRVRMTWRSWSSSAARDDGLLELEWSGGSRDAAPVRVRLGAAGRLDRYGMVEATVARDPGRSLRLHALRRATAAADGTASSTTAGARLELRGRIGALSLLIESTRLRRGAVGWGVALEPSGDVTLRSRSRPGLWIAARGSLGAGRWRLGVALERGED